MTQLVRLYIISIAIGFCLSVVFVGMMLAFDVAHLRALILGSDMGLVALAMAVLAHGVLFSGVQFAISILSMGGHDDTPRGGHLQMIPIRVEARTKQGLNRRR